MTTRTPIGRAIEVPDLVGVNADQAIQMLNELGLVPITWSAEVEEVNEAGFVRGLDSPAGSPVRLISSITVSVGTLPDFHRHADESLAGQAEDLVQRPVTGPGICDFPISPAVCRDALAQPPDGLPAKPC